MISAMTPWKLKRTQQCAKCPWKQGVNPRDIPNGYCETAHRNLAKTIATPGALDGADTAMACHESPPGREYHCVGWLHYQLGPGNNIPLRMMMRHCENAADIQVYGPQHERFEDTLPQPQE